MVVCQERRGNRPEVFFDNGVLKNLAKLTGKHLCQSLLKKEWIKAPFYRTPPVAAC